jgi:beta-lactamase superfamily II metal-dependent hydrolase
MPVKYVNTPTATLTDLKGKKRMLLWGDAVHVDNWPTVTARGVDGTINANVLVDDLDLLEIYVIDVGQGDSVLIKTPDAPAPRWHLIDAGRANKDQMTKKGAANFLRWKFIEDLKQPAVTLENVLISHPDEDHFGGLADVLSGTLFNGNTFPISVANFYHPGIGRFAGDDPVGAKRPGKVDAFPHPGHGKTRNGSFITELLDGAATFANPARPFGDSFAAVAPLIGSVPANVRRLSRSDGFLPGYEPGAASTTVHILGPILETFVDDQDGTTRQGLRSFGGVGQTTNGHSIVLRFDFGQARILLTGDLNETSQNLLLSYVADNEFQVDVAKACHHGAEDVQLDFLKAMKPRATVVSSGDNEDYSHPRPLLLGSAGRYGREGVDDLTGKLMPPLVYSTELARSVKLDDAAMARVVEHREGQLVKIQHAPRYIDVRPEEEKDKNRFRNLTWLPLATNLVYGLVNIRTDGTRILCATLEEETANFDWKVFRAGVNPAAVSPASQ